MTLATTETQRKLVEIPVSKLIPSKYNPRDPAFETEDTLLDLLSQIKSAKGIIREPIVRPHPEKDDFYEILGGHRRIRIASQYLHQTKILCQVRYGLDELESFVIVGADNISEKEITPYEMAIYIKKGEDLLGLTRSQIGALVGKTEMYVSNKIALYNAFNELNRYLGTGDIASFKRNAGPPHLELLMMLIGMRVSDADIARACKIVSDADTSTAEKVAKSVQELKDYVEACKKVYKRAHAGSSSSTSEADTLNVRDLLKTLQQIQKSKSIDDVKPLLEPAMKIARRLEEEEQEYESFKEEIAKPRICPPHGEAKEVRWYIKKGGKIQYITEKAKALMSKNR